jgi:hypothetical protein
VRRAGCVVAVALYAVSPLLIVGLRPVPRVDAWWDFCMALGVAATGLLALLPALSARWWAPQYRAADVARLVQHLHRRLSYLLLALLVAHVLGLVLLEPRVLDYLLPTAPGYMLAGLVGVLLVLALVLTARYRARLRWGNPGWRRWHAAMAVCATGCAAWHLWGAGYYFAAPGVLAAGAWLLFVPLALALCWRLRPPATSTTGRPFAAPGRRALFATIAALLLAAATWLAWPPAVSTPPPSYPCFRCL